MQRCLQAWTPLPRARLQAAATREASRYYSRARTGSSGLSRSHFRRPFLSAESTEQPVDIPHAPTVESASEAPPRPLVRYKEEIHRQHPWVRLMEGQYRKELRMPGASELKVPLNHNAGRWVEEFMDPQLWRSRWLNAAFFLLQNDKERVVHYLVETHDPKRVPSQWVVDIIRLLAMYYSKQEEYIARPVVASIVEGLKTLTTRRTADNPLVFDRGQIRLLLPRLSHGEVQQIYGHLNDGTLVTDWQAYCHLCRYFAAQGDIGQAVDAFIAALSDGIDRKDVLLDTLLYMIGRLIRRPDGYRQSIRLVENLQRFGVAMNPNVANYLIWNALVRSQHGVAIDLYKTLYGKELQPDADTFGLLLKLLQADHSSATGLSLDYIIEEAHRTKVLYKNEFIANHVLHVFSMQALDNANTAWPRLCQMFKRLFEGDVLELLDMPVPSTEQINSEQRLPATDYAVNTMIQAYLKLHAQGYLQESDPVDVYKRFQSLVVKGEQPFLQLAATDHTCNLFLYSFHLERETLINATEVMKDMQTPLPQSIDIERAKPTVQSWTIFLMGFQRHDKPQLAEQVLQHMNNEGMAPNEVTWNTLISGFAHHQQLDDLMRVLQQAEAAGTQFDKYTEKALGRFRNQDELHGALKGRRVQDELDFSSELKASIQARLDADGT